MNEITKNPEYDNLLSLIQQLETELAELVQDRDKLLYHPINGSIIKNGGLPFPAYYWC
jgi:hypothetical protein